MDRQCSRVNLKTRLTFSKWPVQLLVSSMPLCPVTKEEEKFFFNCDVMSACSGKHHNAFQEVQRFVSCTPPESNRDCASASYKSQATAMMFQKQLFPSKNKHILGTCCGVHCLFLQCTLLAPGLAEVNHMLRLFPHFSFSVPLPPFATVRVLVY